MQLVYLIIALENRFLTEQLEHYATDKQGLDACMISKYRKKLTLHSTYPPLVHIQLSQVAIPVVGTRG